jgi:hypothetical protein
LKEGGVEREREKKKRDIQELPEREALALFRT